MIQVFGKQDKDCLRCCFASILEMNYEDIPFIDPDLPTEEFWKEYRIALAALEFNIGHVSAEFYKEIGFKGYTIGMGLTESGIEHAVVCFDGEIVHNSSPKSIIKEIHTYMVLIPMYPWKYKFETKSKNDYILEKS